MKIGLLNGYEPFSYIFLRLPLGYRQEFYCSNTFFYNFAINGRSKLNGKVDLGDIFKENGEALCHKSRCHASQEKMQLFHFSVPSSCLKGF